jgi:hypothetical protein
VVACVAFCYVLVPRGRRLSSLHLFMKSMIGSASPCRLGETSSPPYNWSWRLKSPASTTSRRGPLRHCAVLTASSSNLIVLLNAASLAPSTYTDASNTDLSGSRSRATVRSADGALTCSNSMSLRTYNMLRTAYLPSCLSLGRTAVQPWCPIGLVVTLPSISRTYGSLITRAAYSFKSTSFITLYCTFRLFCTFSYKNLSDLDISRRIENPTLAARRVVWSAIHCALGTVCLAFAITVA